MPAEAYRLCIDDGFQNDEEFINFFKTKYGLPFEFKDANENKIVCFHANYKLRKD